MAVAALVAGAVASVAGTYKQYRNQKKVAALEGQRQAVSTRRSQRQAIRTAQIQRAQTIASAQGGGALESSGVNGGLGSLQSQLGTDLGFSTQMSGLGREIGTAQSKAAQGAGLAQLGGLAYGYGASRGASFSGLFPTRAPNQASQPAMNTDRGLYGASASGY